MNKITIIVIIIILILLTISGIIVYFNTGTSSSSKKTSDTKTNESEDDDKKEDEPLITNECPAYSKYEYMDIPDYTQRVIENVDEDRCINECLSDGPECHWVNYRNDQKKCYIKKADKQDGLDVYFKVNNPKENCPKIVKYSNYNIGKFDMKDAKKRDTSESDCDKWCDEKNCKFYVYNRNNRICTPKQGIVKDGDEAYTIFPINN